MMNDLSQSCREITAKDRREIGTKLLIARIVDYTSTPSKELSSLLLYEYLEYKDE